MKGGVAAIIMAGLQAVKEKLPVKLIFGVDEEDISAGAHDICSSGKLSQLAYLIVAESGQVVDFSQPISVGIGRRGRVALDISLQGKAAHAAESELGVNAISKAAELIRAIERLPLPHHPNLGGSSLILQSIEAHAESLTVPDRCNLKVSLLTTPGVTSGEISRQIVELGNSLGIQVSCGPVPRATPYGEAYALDLDEPRTARIFKELLTPMGVKPIYNKSVADENVFASRLGIPVLTLGPVGAGDHTKDEWVRLSSLERVVETFGAILKMFYADSPSR